LTECSVIAVHEGNRPGYLPAVDRDNRFVSSLSLPIGWLLMRTYGSAKTYNLKRNCLEACNINETCVVPGNPAQKLVVPGITAVAYRHTSAQTRSEHNNISITMLMNAESFPNINEAAKYDEVNVFGCDPV
jgi:hypothetical protein